MSCHQRADYADSEYLFAPMKDAQRKWVANYKFTILCQPAPLEKKANRLEIAAAILFNFFFFFLLCVDGQFVYVAQCVWCRRRQLSMIMSPWMLEVGYDVRGREPSKHSHAPHVLVICRIWPNIIYLLPFEVATLEWPEQKNWLEYLSIFYRYEYVDICILTKWFIPFSIPREEQLRDCRSVSAVV